MPRLSGWANGAEGVRIAKIGCINACTVPNGDIVQFGAKLATQRNGNCSWGKRNSTQPRRRWQQTTQRQENVLFSQNMWVWGRFGKWLICSRNFASPPGRVDHNLWPVQIFLAFNLVYPQDLPELRKQTAKLRKDVALVQEFKAKLKATGQEKCLEMWRKLEEADIQQDLRNSGGKKWSTAYSLVFFFLSLLYFP